MEHAGWNIVDLAVLGIILVSGLMALIRGFVRELLALASWIGASLAAVYLHSYARPLMLKYVHNEHMANIAAGIVIFCIVLALFIPLGMLLSSLVRGKALTAVDRSLGFVFGLTRGTLIVCLLFLVTLWIWPEKKDEPASLADAKTRPLLVYGADLLQAFVPKEDMDRAVQSAKTNKENIDQILDAKTQLDRLSTPVPGGTVQNPPPAYDDKSRSGLDQLINQKGTQ